MSHFTRALMVKLFHVLLFLCLTISSWSASSLHTCRKRTGGQLKAWATTLRKVMEPFPDGPNENGWVTISSELAQNLSLSSWKRVLPPFYPVNPALSKLRFLVAEIYAMRPQFAVRMFVDIATHACTHCHGMRLFTFSSNSALFKGLCLPTYARVT